MHLAYHQVQSTGSKWLQMAPKYSKWFQITMAEANCYGNGPILSQMVPNGQKWSKTIHNDPTSKMVKYDPRMFEMVLKGKKWSRNVQYGLKWSSMVPNGPK